MRNSCGGVACLGTLLGRQLQTLSGASRLCVPISRPLGLCVCISSCKLRFYSTMARNKNGRQTWPELCECLCEISLFASCKLGPILSTS